MEGLNSEHHLGTLPALHRHVGAVVERNGEAETEAEGLRTKRVSRLARWHNMLMASTQWLESHTCYVTVCTLTVKRQ